MPINISLSTKIETKANGVGSHCRSVVKGVVLRENLLVTGSSGCDTSGSLHISILLSGSVSPFK